MRRVLDSSEAVGQQHLYVPIAAEVAIALQFMNVLDALVAEVGDSYVSVVGAEICQDWNGAWLFIVDDCFAEEFACWANAAFVAGFGRVFETAADVFGHALFEGVGSQFFCAQSAAVRVIFQGIFWEHRVAGVCRACSVGFAGD